MSAIDIATIKTNIKNVLDTNNTTTSSVLDLSSSMTQRVQKVLTVNPERIPLQASFFPCVTTYIESKTINHKDISRTALAAKKEAELSFKVVGMVWNHNWVDDLSDPADNDIELLMENLEQVLRSDPRLSNQVNWAIPQNTDYYITTLDEQTHMRAGVLDLKIKLFY